MSVRFRNQVVKDSAATGQVFKGKNVRKATHNLASSLSLFGIGSLPKNTVVGVARIMGYEVPVKRTSPGRWVSLDVGTEYSAKA